jgi:predicted ATPase/DNA-binding SARP family transcriptional activator
VNSHLDVVTLGGLSIQQDGKLVTGFVSRKVEALFVYLAANPREHPREVLGQLLWDDLSQERTQANLRMALSSLQEQLSPYLLVTRYSLAINPDSAYRLDVTELDSALTEANQQWKESGSFTPAEAKRMEGALNLYRGSFLDGFYVRNARGFEGWKLLEQERIRYRVQEALYRLGTSALKHGQYDQGITHISQLLQYDPLWEEAHRLMMLLLASSGNRSAALAQYQTCQTLLKENLNVDPSDETFDLYCQIDDGEVKTVLQERIPHNLPAPTTGFVGRSRELGEMTEQLNNPTCRLLTLIGPGGIGKTHLALEAARQNLALFPQGVYFVALNSVVRSDMIVPTIADALQLTLTGASEPLEDLLAEIHDKQMLLILDNFEDLLEGAALLSDILAGAAQVKILVTSTSRLNLQEEWLYPVEGLPVEVGDDEPAIQLFVQTAQRVKRDFALDGQREFVAKICNLVAGLPLGIEMAASWVHLLSCQQIAEQISEDPAFLSTSLRNLPERHRSLHVLFDQALTRLDAQSRAAFVRLSVFRGGFTRQAAAQVAGASLAALATLVEKSLLHVPDSGWYDMHTLFSRFAYTLLEQSGELAATENAHIHYYTELAEKLAQTEDDTQISIMYGNLYLALSRAFDSQQGDNLKRLANALTFYWRRRGHLAEGRQWLQQALSVPTQDADLQAAALANSGLLAWNQSDFATANDRLTESLQLYRQQGDQDGVCYVLRYLGYVAMNQGQFEMAQADFEDILSSARQRNNLELMVVALGNLGQVAMEQNDLEQAKIRIDESLMIARQQNAPTKVSVLLNNLGNIYLAQTDYAQARTCYEESLTIARTLDNKSGIAFALVNLGEVAHNLGDYDAALTHYREGAHLLKEMGDQLSITAVLESYAYIMVDRGETEQAIRLLGITEAARESLNAPIPPREQARYQRYLDAVKTRINADQFAMIWRTGRLLGIDHALSELDI